MSWVAVLRPTSNYLILYSKLRRCMWLFRYFFLSIIYVLIKAPFITLNLIICSWFLTLLLVLILKLLASPIFHLFLNLYIDSQLINAITKKFSRSPPKISSLASPPICTPHSSANPIKASTRSSTTFIHYQTPPQFPLDSIWIRLKNLKHDIM